MPNTRTGWTNYHSHSHYCDGKLSPEATVRAAIEQGMPAIGCSSHVPMKGGAAWNMPAHKLPEYLTEIQSLKERYAEQIEVYSGMEVDFVPEVVSPQSPAVKAMQLDYSVGSIHYVEAFPDGSRWEIDGPHRLFLEGVKTIFEGDASLAVKRYFELTREMIAHTPPEVIGHLDKISIQSENDRLFDTRSDWYRQEVMQTLEVIAASNCIVEVNTRGLYKKITAEPYPARWILKALYDQSTPIMLNSDSHHPRELTLQFGEVAGWLQAIGFQELWVLYQNTWQPRPFSTQGIVFD